MSSRLKKYIDPRERIYGSFGRMRKADVVKHLLKKTIPCTTIYSTVERCRAGLSVKGKLKKGRSAKINRKGL